MTKEKPNPAICLVFQLINAPLSQTAISGQLIRTVLHHEILEYDWLVR